VNVAHVMNQRIANPFVSNRPFGSNSPRYRAQHESMPRDCRRGGRRMGGFGIDWYITSGIVLALYPLTSFAPL